jgi:transcriptional regulator with XRE-family HTH domain
MSRVPHHPAGLGALRILALSIRSARKQRRWTLEEFSSRLGVDKSTAIRIEKGDPRVAVGTFFDAAALTGVTLYSPDERGLAAETRRLEHELTLLPSRIDSPRGRTNDF